MFHSLNSLQRTSFPFKYRYFLRIQTINSPFNCSARSMHLSREILLLSLSLTQLTTIATIMKVSKNLRFTQHTGFIFMGLSNYFKHPSSKLCPSIGNKCPFSLAVNRRIGCDYSSSTARSYSNFRFDFHANNIVYESSERTLDKCKNILALDFDGVVCASAEESSSTAVLTAKEIWKYNYSNMPTDSQTTDTKVIEILKALRPIIETGYESVLLARRIHEILAEKQGNNIFDNKGVIEEIVSLWSPSFRDSLISEYKSSKVRPSPGY